MKEMNYMAAKALGLDNPTAVAVPTMPETMVERVTVLESKGSEDHAALVRADIVLAQMGDHINEIRRELGLQPIIIDPPIQP
jgi:hypothetical protein